MSHVEQPAEPTIGRLIADASRDVSTLIQSEIALAKSELRVSAKAGGIGAGLLAATAFLGMLISVMLSIALAYFLTMTGMHPAWAFLIVAVLYIVIAAVLGFVGVRKLKKIRAPEKTIATAKEIPSALKGQTTTPALHRSTTR